MVKPSSDEAGRSLLSVEQVQFVQGPVSITAASCDAARRPSVARALACRVSADRHSLCLLFAERRAAELLADLRHGGAIAAVFSQPSTHRSFQLKARRAEILPPAADDEARARRHAAAFAAEIGALGFPRELAHALLSPGGDPLVAVRFVPSEGYAQTPGPRAGGRMEWTT